MRQDDDDFSYKSKKYRKEYISGLQGLYGKEPPIVENKPKVKRSYKHATRPLEKQIQSALVKWARLNGLFLISIPNQGKRSKWCAQREIAMGLTRGVSDLFLAMPSRKYRYHGFWLEMKVPGNKPFSDQYRWLDNMRAQGYMTGWYDDWEVAKIAIEIYLG